MTKRDAADMPATRHYRRKTNKMPSSANSQGSMCERTHAANLPAASAASVQFSQTESFRFSLHNEEKKDANTGGFC